MNDYPTLYRLAHRVTTLYEKLKMNQLPLLSKVPASRRTDNAASYRAEELQNKSGLRAKGQHQALEAVRQHPGCTSKELAEITGLDRYMLARRLPDLHPVHVMRIDGKDGYRWFAKGIISLTPMRPNET